jgi:hypothetical protein
MRNCVNRMIGIAGVMLLAAAAALAPSGAALATNSDFALFDGTNPANQPFSGAVCGSGSAKKLNSTFFTYNISASNFGTSTAVLRVIFHDGDIARYQIPAGQSFSVSQAAGSNSADAAIRVVIESDGQVAGEVSAQGPKVFCLGCDADSAGDAASDAVIPDE